MREITRGSDTHPNLLLVAFRSHGLRTDCKHYRARFLQCHLVYSAISSAIADRPRTNILPFLISHWTNISLKPVRAFAFTRPGSAAAHARRREIWIGQSERSKWTTWSILTQIKKKMDGQTFQINCASNWTWGDYSTLLCLRGYLSVYQRLLSWNWQASVMFRDLFWPQEAQVCRYVLSLRRSIIHAFVVISALADLAFSTYLLAPWQQ